QV
ncbi:putative aTP-dependent dsDNA exonuclease SbcC, partial [Vibrio parahaemolyticus V-223/04]